jgi:hypothetical protein
MVISGIYFSGSPQGSIILTLFHDLPFPVNHLVLPSPSQHNIFFLMTFSHMSCIPNVQIVPIIHTDRNNTNTTNNSFGGTDLYLHVFLNNLIIHFIHFRKIILLQSHSCFLQFFAIFYVEEFCIQEFFTLFNFLFNWFYTPIL